MLELMSTEEREKKFAQPLSIRAWIRVSARCMFPSQKLKGVRCSEAGAE